VSGSLFGSNLTIEEEKVIFTGEGSVSTDPLVLGIADTQQKT
jgi:hypothetical protein